MIKLNGHEINFNTFPNGETYADIPMLGGPVNSPLHIEKPNAIFFKFENDAEIFNLIRLKKMVEDKAPYVPCILNMPYIPYSRMDREEEERMFSLKYFASMINSLGFSRVNVMEPHSEVSAALFDHIHVENKSAKLALQAMMEVLGLSGSAWLDNRYDFDNHDFSLQGLFERAKKAGIYLVYPDAGAEKRYRKQIKYSKVLTCSKDRDFNTGWINSIVINGDHDVDDCKIAIIVDDLSSKGTTFSMTAEALRKTFGVEQVILCVTHCEDTIYKGDVLVGENIDKVYTTNSILTQKPETVKEREKLIVENIID